MAGTHNVFTDFPKDPHCEVGKLTTTTQAPCRNRQDAREDHVGDAVTEDQDHKVDNEENESRLLWCTTVILSGSHFSQRKTKLGKLR